MQCPIIEPMENAKYGFCPIVEKQVIAPFDNKYIDFALKNCNILCNGDLDNCEFLGDPEKVEQMKKIIDEKATDKFGEAIEYWSIMDTLSESK